MSLQLTDFNKEVLIPYINLLSDKVERVLEISTEGHLVLKDVVSGDTIRETVEKINYNFHSIMKYGGGPQGVSGPQGLIGQKGESGLQGPQGIQGIRGTKWYLSSSTSDELNFSTVDKLEGDFIVDGNLQTWIYESDNNGELVWKKSVNFDRQFNLFHYNETTKQIRKNKDINSSVILGNFESSASLLNFNNDGVLHILTNSGDINFNNAIEISSFTLNDNAADVNNSKLYISNNDGVGKIILTEGKSLEISSNIKMGFKVGSNEILSFSNSKGLLNGSLFISNTLINAIPSNLSSMSGIIHTSNGVFIGLKANTSYTNLNNYGLYVNKKGYFGKGDTNDNIALQLNGLLQFLNINEPKNNILISDESGIMQLKSIDSLLTNMWKRNDGIVELENNNDIVKIGDVDSIGKLNIDGSIYVKNVNDGIYTMINVVDYENTTSNNIIGGIDMIINGIVGINSFDIYVE